MKTIQRTTDFFSDNFRGGLNHDIGGVTPISGSNHGLQRGGADNSGPHK
jgi:hypothetical protein